MSQTAVGWLILATAALTLYEEGKYSLLDPVSKYIPEFENMKVAIDTVTATSQGFTPGLTAVESSASEE